MNNKEKREAIEKALRPTKEAMHSQLESLGADWGELHFARKVFHFAIAALAKEAVVIPVEIEHILPGVDPVGCPNGYTIADGVFNLPYPEEGIPIEDFRYEAEGIHGKPGKAIAIIIPEEEK